MMKNYELNVSTQNVKLQFNPLLLIGDVICSILREKKLVSDARLFSAKPALVNVQVSFVLCLYDTHFCFGNDKQTKYSYNNSTNVRDLILFFFFLFFTPSTVKSVNQSFLMAIEEGILTSDLEELLASHFSSNLEYYKNGSIVAQIDDYRSSTNFIHSSNSINQEGKYLLFF